ncbi:MAG: hypothetical protein PF505_10500 [Vallitaleaceae bacterium]|jgi:hypothetical protein|nr:hypothetical protein [Vallitaleaceae bacterium]
MDKLKGVFLAKKKNGDVYYRSSITYRNKHISLGSYVNHLDAHLAYLDAKTILFDGKYNYLDYRNGKMLKYEKWIILCNFRDNGIYIKNPIFLHKTYFSYFLYESSEYKFDVDDLFYYSNLKIFKKDGYLFVNDYGMQLNILNRYGIKNFAVEGKDYCFIDGDSTNFSRHNIQIINGYYGVEQKTKKHHTTYIAKINIIGKHVIGEYASEVDAAIAYNKTADFIKDHEISSKQYQYNYIMDLSVSQYKTLYDKIRIPTKIQTLINQVNMPSNITH